MNRSLSIGNTVTLRHNRAWRGKITGRLGRASYRVEWFITDTSHATPRWYHRTDLVPV